MSYLTRKQAAERIGTTPGVLAVWATQPDKRRALPYETDGWRVRYLESDVENFIKNRWKRVSE